MSSNPKGRRAPTGDRARPGSGGSSHSYAAKHGRPRPGSGESKSKASRNSLTSPERTTTSKANGRIAPAAPSGQSRASASKSKPVSKQSRGSANSLSAQPKAEKSLRRSISPRKEQYSHLLDESVGCGDMVLLEPLTENGLIENIHLRYKAGEIYTYIGPVVVSVNPYRSLNIYTSEYVEEYRSRSMFEMPPHIYAVSDEAYRSMRDKNTDQCVIISGESGAGKTEASKLVMQYVAAVSSKGEEVNRVKQQLLKSNPVLEAFGNAKTTRNDNSSRFGKYMDIEFNYQGSPVGGIITNYLLEKSRVVAQLEGERNFHIFYQLLAGSSSDVLQMIHLEQDDSCYQYLGASEATKITAQDKKDFEETIQAMEVIGFQPDEISSTLELLASILNLGNVRFSGDTLPDGTDSCSIQDTTSLSYACDMIGCSLELLEECLTKRSVETRTDFVLKPLSQAEGVYARDALCKAIYDRLFSWLVKRINDRIKAKSKMKKKVMGVLDIYGFEVKLEETGGNSFEQFIINYCNEKLQQVFIELTLKSEQEEYVLEGIKWEHIDYFNNAVICRLIEHPSEGMMAYIDDECLRPGHATDETLLEKFNKMCISHKHYESRASREFRNDHTLDRNQFRLVHYAGKVTYNVGGFLDKNRDLLFKDLSKAMYACERPMLQQLFPEGNLELQTLKRPPTAGYQLRNSVSLLMKNLLAKNPNYIRCIKPNDRKQAFIFDEPLVRHQVSYLGLYENVRVRRAGFAHRQEYGLALARYKMLSKETWPNWTGRPLDGVREILKGFIKSKKDYACGRTKIFIRHPQIVFDMERARKRRMHDLATLIQKMYKGWHCWKQFQEMRKAQIVIATNFLRYKYRTWFLRLRASTIVIQSFYRGWVAREELRRLKYIKAATWAAGIIRKWFYGWQVRKMVREMKYRALVEESVVIIQSYYRGWRVRRYYILEQAAVVIQKHFRGWRVRRYYRLEQAALVIQKYFRGWRVRLETRALFKQVAGPKVADFMWRALCYRYLVNLYHNLPTESPLDKRWPRFSFLFKKTSDLLRVMHHRWRCKVLRDYYIQNPRERKKLSEKARASSLFRGKKSLYPKTIAVPFKADRLNLRSDDRWARLVAQTHEQRIIWADHVQKINRTDMKGTPAILVVTGISFMVLDPKSLTLKYRVELQYLKQVSLSSYSDHIFVLHIDTYKATDRSYAKGDFMFKCPNCIEMVTKTYAAIQENLSRKLKVVITNEFNATFKIDDEPCSIHFQHDPRASHTSPICRRKGRNITITV